MNPTRENIAQVIDHTFLKTEKEGVSKNEQEKKIVELVEQAKKYSSYAICVREDWVKFSKKLCEGSAIKIVSVIGFPDGDAFTTEEKISLLQKARQGGADEFDMVIRVQKLKQNFLDKVYEDIFQVSKAAEDNVLKVIFETAYLNREEKDLVYTIAAKAFCDSIPQKRFFKTSTGFAQPEKGIAVGATLHDVKRMHEISQGRFGIKPAGGVQNYDDAIKFWQACGSPWDENKKCIDPLKYRIGTSSLLSNLFESVMQKGY